MAQATSIEWTDATWNPVRGCRRVSPGCENCYAERIAARFSGPGQPYEGLAQMTKGGPRWTGRIQELRYTQSGVPVTSFRIAVDRPFANQQGEREADFFPVQTWRKLAEVCAHNLSKGRLVAENDPVRGYGIVAVPPQSTVLAHTV